MKWPLIVPLLGLAVALAAGVWLREGETVSKPARGRAVDTGSPEPAGIELVESAGTSEEEPRDSSPSRPTAAKDRVGGGAEECETSDADDEFADPFGALAQMSREGASPEAFAEMEEVLREHLSELEPNRAVEYLVRSEAPIVTHLMLSYVDERLMEDRPVWEEAMRHAVETSAPSPDRLASISEFAEHRIEDPKKRSEVARLLMKSGDDDRLMFLSARFADGEAFEEVREHLWSRVPDAAAVEALGYVIEPDEVPKLMSSGNPDAAGRALDIAFYETRNPAFRMPHR